jgi:hypothetical protein
LIKAELAREAKEPPEDKMRRILQSHVDEAKTDKERERAERELAKLQQFSSRQTLR